MDLFTVDREKCIKCGACIDECPRLVLNMGKTGPETAAAKECISCGHCVAVCPRAALDYRLTPLAGQIDISGFSKPSAEEAACFLRSRRSIRRYLTKRVPREELVRLVEIARFAPTGSNSQGVSYVIVDDRAVLDKAVEMVIERLESDELLRQRFSHYLKVYHDSGADTVLRGAPALILTIADSAFARGRENSVFSLAYLELYAPAVGLGSCWAGILEICALEENSPLLELFHIPEGKRITGAVMVGYPQYSYKRLVDRNPLDVAFYEPEA